MAKIKTISCVEAIHMPIEVDDYCCDREVSTHSTNSIIQLFDDGNPFSEWLKTLGYQFKDTKWGDYVGIIALMRLLKKLCLDDDYKGLKLFGFPTM